MQENLEKNARHHVASTERHNKEREFNDLNRDFQRKQREFREDLNLRQNEEMAAIFERVNKVIKQIAEAEKYDLILQEAVYVSPRIDITDKVIKALGRRQGSPLRSRVVSSPPRRDRRPLRRRTGRRRRVAGSRHRHARSAPARSS